MIASAAIRKELWYIFIQRCEVNSSGCTIFHGGSPWARAKVLPLKRAIFKNFFLFRISLLQKPGHVWLAIALISIHQIKHHVSAFAIEYVHTTNCWKISTSSSLLSWCIRWRVIGWFREEWKGTKQWKVSSHDLFYVCFYWQLSIRWPVRLFEKHWSIYII